MLRAVTSISTLRRGRIRRCRTRIDMSAIPGRSRKPASIPADRRPPARVLINRSRTNPRNPTLSKARLAGRHSAPLVARSRAMRVRAQRPALPWVASPVDSVASTKKDIRRASSKPIPTPPITTVGIRTTERWRRVFRDAATPSTRLIALRLLHAVSRGEMD
jgi:hypothetical protein